jgi:hypothetical protein
MAVNKGIKNRIEAALASNYFDMLKRNMVRATTFVVCRPYEK